MEVSYQQEKLDIQWLFDIWMYLSKLTTEG